MDVWGHFYTNQFAARYILDTRASENCWLRGGGVAVLCSYRRIPRDDL